MKLWFDECLTPTLVGRANERVFATNNESDFVALSREVELHTGLMILPQVARREAAWPLLDSALDYIEKQATGMGESTGD